VCSSRGDDCREGSHSGLPRGYQNRFAFTENCGWITGNPEVIPLPGKSCRLSVEAARSNRRAISRSGESEAIPREMSSRSASVSASRERRRASGGMPPRGSNTERMQLWGLSKARPISCSDCPAFHRFQTSRFSIAESPNRCPGLMPTQPLHSSLTSDGVASTYRMHRVYQDLAGNFAIMYVLSLKRTQLRWHAKSRTG